MLSQGWHAFISINTAHVIRPLRLFDLQTVCHGSELVLLRKSFIRRSICAACTYCTHWYCQVFDCKNWVFTTLKPPMFYIIAIKLQLSFFLPKTWTLDSGYSADSRLVLFTFCDTSVVSRCYHQCGHWLHKLMVWQLSGCSLPQMLFSLAFTIKIRGIFRRRIFSKFLLNLNAKEQNIWSRLLTSTQERMTTDVFYRLKRFLELF